MVLEIISRFIKPCCCRPPSICGSDIWHKMLLGMMVVLFSDHFLGDDDSLYLDQSISLFTSVTPGYFQNTFYEIKIVLTNFIIRKIGMVRGCTSVLYCHGY